MLRFDTFVRASAVVSILACAACSTTAASEEEASADVAENAIGTSDPFASTYCVGAPIEASEAAARFAPGATHVELGHFDVEARKRSCNLVSGCTAWKRVTTELFYTIRHELDYSSYNETWRMPRTQRGTIAFDVVSGATQLTLRTDPITLEDQYGSRSAVVEFDTPVVAPTFEHPSTILKMCEQGGPTCNYSAYPGGGYPSFISGASGIVTKDCVQHLVPFRADTVADGSEWTEYEYVWYGRF